MFARDSFSFAEQLNEVETLPFFQFFFAQIQRTNQNRIFIELMPL